MDAHRFDSFAKRLAAPATRRATLGAGAAVGLLNALGLSRAAPAVRASQGGPCVFAFVATVRLGPSVDQILIPNAARPGELRGELHVSLSETGNLEAGVLRLPGGGSLPVVGQAIGHSLQMRIELAPRAALVAVGVGEQEVAACQGAIDGVVTGPEVGDLGDWHIAVLRRTRDSGRASAGGSAASTGNRPAGPTSPTPRAGTGTTSPALAGSTGRSGVTGASTAAAATPTPRAGGMLDLTSPTGPSGPSAGAGCGPGLTDCGGDCVDLASNLTHCGRCQLPCAGGLCVGGVCGPAGVTCPVGQVNCGDGCIDLSSNNASCGACGTGCEVGQACQGGVCTEGAPQCAAGLTDCAGACVDLGSDNAHCGECGGACEDEQSCQGGFCSGDPLCPGPEANCGGTCADLQSDPAHCGACGAICAAGQTCQAGVCTGGAPVCAAGQTDCGGVCVDVQSNVTHCGFCGNACEAGATCADGGCSNDHPCTGGKKLCALACVDVLTDPTNCGSCGNVCENGACQGGVCSAIVDQGNLRVSCVATGLSTCNGVCIDLESDALNCGVCGLECAYGEICSAGACQSSCAAGFSFCNGVCVDTASDPGNCGFCNNACTGFNQCVAGACIDSGEALPSSELSCAARGLTDCGGGCVDLLNDDSNCGACGNACYPGTCNNFNGTCSICDPGNDVVTGRSNCA